MVDRKHSDQEYVLGLCDGVLGQAGIREHTFDGLVGDPGKNGLRRRLPVDAFYPELGLVVEYREQQQTRPVRHFDKPDKMTASGVHRGEQRKLHDQRRRDVLPGMGIKLVEIDCDDFGHDAARRLRRSPVQDEAVVRRKLSGFLPAPPAVLRT